MIIEAHWVVLAQLGVVAGESNSVRVHQWNYEGLHAPKLELFD